jgi:hypothetical protein
MTTFREARLGDFRSALTIRRGFPTQRAVPDAPMPVLSLAALRNNTSPRAFASWDDLHDLGLDPARPGDVLIAVEGGTLGEAMVLTEGRFGEFVPSQQVATVRIHDPAELDPWYLGAWLATDVGREQVRRLARGAGIQRVPVSELMSLILKVPALHTQRVIGEKFLAFENAIQGHRAVTDCLERLRDVDLAIAFQGS